MRPFPLVCRAICSSESKGSEPALHAANGSGGEAGGNALYRTSGTCKLFPTPKGAQWEWVDQEASVGKEDLNPLPIHQPSALQWTFLACTSSFWGISKKGTGRLQKRRDRIQHVPQLLNLPTTAVSPPCSFPLLPVSPFPTLATALPGLPAIVGSRDRQGAAVSTKWPPRECFVCCWWPFCYSGTMQEFGIPAFYELLLRLLISPR